MPMLQYTHGWSSEILVGFRSLKPIAYVADVTSINSIPSCIYSKVNLHDRLS